MIPLSSGFSLFWHSSSYTQINIHLLLSFLSLSLSSSLTLTVSSTHIQTHTQKKDIHIHTYTWSKPKYVPMRILAYGMYRAHSFGEACFYKCMNSTSMQNTNTFSKIDWKTNTKNHSFCACVYVCLDICYSFKYDVKKMTRWHLT